MLNAHSLTEKKQLDRKIILYCHKNINIVYITIIKTCIVSYSNQEQGSLSCIQYFCSWTYELNGCILLFTMACYPQIHQSVNWISPFRLNQSISKFRFILIVHINLSLVLKRYWLLISQVKVSLKLVLQSKMIVQVSGTSVRKICG